MKRQGLIKLKVNKGVTQGEGWRAAVRGRLGRRKWSRIDISPDDTLTQPLQRLGADDNVVTAEAMAAGLLWWPGQLD